MIDPDMMSRIAGRSYLQRNFSSKRVMDKKILSTIAMEELAERRVKSA